jgi:molybdopterin converting factor small subunit
MLISHIGQQCFVTSMAHDPEYALHNDDEVAIFPPIAGGAAQKLPQD